MAETGIPTSGSGDSVTVGDLLQALADESRTGLLRFDGDDQRLVCLEEGEVYLATSASGPSIHQIVVGSGAVPEAAWADAAETSGGLAETLAKDDRVDADRLRAVLHEHSVSTVVELLVPGTERYELLPDQSHHLGAFFRFPVPEVVAEAGRRLIAWRAIGATLPSTSTRVRRAPALPTGCTSDSLTAVEWQVVAAMPAEGTVAEVIAAAGLSAFTVFDVLHGLVRRGLVEPIEGPAPTT
jgi:Domain of unknown function (DUF4388)